jgi:hypothetical protein
MRVCLKEREFSPSAGAIAAIDIDSTGNIVKARPPADLNTETVPSTTAVMEAAAAASAAASAQTMARSSDTGEQLHVILGVDGAVVSAKEEVRKWINDFMDNNSNADSTRAGASDGASGALAHGSGSVRGAVAKSEEELKVCHHEFSTFVPQRHRCG